MIILFFLFIIIWLICIIGCLKYMIQNNIELSMRFYLIVLLAIIMINIIAFFIIIS